MMRDPDVAVVHRSVDQIVRMFDRTRPNSFRPSNLFHFRDLTDGLALDAQVRSLGLTRVELHSIAGAALLGPSEMVPLSARYIRDMIEALTKREPDPVVLLKFLPHFVLVYGLGRDRAVKPGQMGVDQTWDRSFDELKLMILSCLADINEWLRLVVPAFSTTFFIRRGAMFVPIEENLRPVETARELALKLQFPTKNLAMPPGQEMTAVCDGETARLFLPGMDREWIVPSYSKQVFTVSGESVWQPAHSANPLPIADGGKMIVSVGDHGARVETRVGDKRPGLELQFRQSARLVGARAIVAWACTCGNDQCVQRHWLYNWKHIMTDQKGEKHDYDLHSFVATALKGPGADGQKAAHAIQPNAFSTTLYFSHLNRVGL